jgi:hypothetical protein
MFSFLPSVWKKIYTHSVSKYLSSFNGGIYSALYPNMRLEEALKCAPHLKISESGWKKLLQGPQNLPPQSLEASFRARMGGCWSGPCQPQKLPDRLESAFCGLNFRAIAGDALSSPQYQRKKQIKPTITCSFIGTSPLGGRSSTIETISNGAIAGDALSSPQYQRKKTDEAHNYLFIHRHKPIRRTQFHDWDYLQWQTHSDPNRKCMADGYYMQTKPKNVLFTMKLIGYTYFISVRSIFLFG